MKTTFFGFFYLKAQSLFLSFMFSTTAVNANCQATGKFTTMEVKKQRKFHREKLRKFSHSIILPCTYQSETEWYPDQYPSHPRYGVQLLHYPELVYNPTYAAQNSLVSGTADTSWIPPGVSSVYVRKQKFDTFAHLEWKIFLLTVLIYNLYLTLLVQHFSLFYVIVDLLSL